ncbi:hypothetical protein [Microbacterium sp. PMB16]|uniref:hypothetical protein n=1 Tax=Microbacterium sp. PMB16 TaxID=3120157 RepID=UPI003F4BC0F1
MRASRSIAAAITVLVTATLVTGCTLRIVNPGADGSDTPAGSQRSETPAAEMPEEGAPEAETPKPDEDPTPPAGLDAEHAAHRERLLASATTTMPCPSGPLQQDGAIIRVEGACDEIRIDLDAGAVIVDDVSSLLLSGSGTVVYADTVGEVRVSGTANEIYWVGETPGVTDTGTANVLRRG